MSIDYDKLYKRLEEKVEEGIALLPRAVIGEDGYRQLLDDLVETISLVKNFDTIGEEEKEELEPMQGNGKTIQVGDPYMSLDGSSDDRKIVMFSSDGCTFCNLAKPVYLPALAQAGVPVEIVSLDEQEGNEFAQRLGIQGIPAFLMVKDGRVTNAFQGYDTKITDEQNKKNLLNAVERFL